MCIAINNRNFVVKENVRQPEAPWLPRDYTEKELQQMIEKVAYVLAGIFNISAPEPDGVNYKLLKAIRKTNLGRTVLQDIVHELLCGILPAEWKEIRVVMILKLRKDYKQIRN